MKILVIGGTRFFGRAFRLWQSGLTCVLLPLNRAKLKQFSGNPEFFPYS